MSAMRARRAVPVLHTVRFLAFISACSCAALLALAACGSARSPEPTTSASPALAGFTGYDWRVVAIRREGQVTRIPARLDVDLRFSRNGRFLADDPVNSHSGAFRITPGGFATGVLGVTLVGYAGHDPVILLSQNAISAFDNGAQAAVRVTGNRLVVSVASYTLTCQRHGPAGNKL
jgi:heat shock protein HslJ